MMLKQCIFVGLLETLSHSTVFKDYSCTAAAHVCACMKAAQKL